MYDVRQFRAIQNALPRVVVAAFGERFLAMSRINAVMCVRVTSVPADLANWLDRRFIPPEAVDGDAFRWVPAIWDF